MIPKFLRAWVWKKLQTINVHVFKYLYTWLTMFTTNLPSNRIYHIFF